MHAVKPQSKQKGATMVEVLVSVVILSIGMLGLAGLQTTGLRVNHSSHQRSLATLYAYDMLDRMRANPAAISAGNYNAIDSTPADPACISVNCTPAQMAQHDAREWNTLIAANLPSGLGRVSGNGSVFTVTVMWDDLRSGSTGTNCGNGDLLCLQVQARLSP